MATEQADSCNVAAALADQARTQPDTPAIHYPSGVRRGEVRYRSASYAELDVLSDRYARGLIAYGIGRGTRVALMVTPGLEFFALFFALFKAGTVPILIDPGIGLDPLKSCLKEAEPEAFIGVTRAQAARVLLRWSPETIRRSVTVGPRLFWGGISLRKLARLGGESGDPVLAATAPDEMAAILFTSGSTGIPKGVVYRHRHFVAQVELLRDAFGIKPGEVDLATFPPFALFDPALGMTTVVPEMDPTRPAKANPRYLVQAIERFGVTNLFGSPALLKVLGQHAQSEGLRFPRLKRALSAGAAVPPRTVEQVHAILGEGGAVHTPYGATECLPVASISSRELTAALQSRTRRGEGTCVGVPVPPNLVKILRVLDEPMDVLHPEDLLPPGEVGEIIVHGPTTTDRYWRRESQTRLAKIQDDEGRIWHRMGDVGYFDDEGRLWYCGRKSQRVQTRHALLYADQVEAIFNDCEGVERTALVGIPAGEAREPVLCVELTANTRNGRSDIQRRLLERAAGFPQLRDLRRVLFHPGFPVDIRHNSKIGREALTAWAREQLS